MKQWRETSLGTNLKFQEDRGFILQMVETIVAQEFPAVSCGGFPEDKSKIEIAGTDCSRKVSAILGG